MRIAYLDCFSGISGDMLLGALVDAGVPAHLFEQTVASLNVGARLEISRVNRSGITASKVDVLVQSEKELPREVYWEQQAHKHQLEHSHRHDHSPGHSSVPDHHRAETAQGRSLKDIMQIISGAAISQGAKQTAIQVFEALGQAEAKIHSRHIEAIHFHEIGAVDAMVDIVCAAVGAEALLVKEWVCSPVNVGGGTVRCAHGTFPVPAPATVELLKGAPVYSSGPDFELVTPTGAALVKTLTGRFSSFPRMRIDQVGYGAGTRDFVGHANVVRLTTGESLSAAESETSEETITVLETNLDDLNPQVFGYLLDRLQEDGALDAFGLPVQMKKNRPGVLLTVFCRPEDAARLTQLIFTETSTLGVRRRDEKRQVLEREWRTVSTGWGDIRIKIASMNGTITNYAPEYEDCRRIAAQHHVPLKTVIEDALQAYLRTRERAQK